MGLAYKRSFECVKKLLKKLLWKLLQGWAAGCVAGWVVEWVGGRLAGLLGWLGGCVDGWFGGSVSGGWLDGCMAGWAWWLALPRPIGKVSLAGHWSLASSLVENTKRV